MNHRWDKNNDFKPHDGYYMQHTCNRCGMIKEKHVMKMYGKNFYDEHFTRSNISWGFKSGNNYIPECLDWNDNTLD